MNRLEKLINNDEIHLSTSDWNLIFSSRRVDYWHCLDLCTHRELLQGYFAVYKGILVKVKRNYPNQFHKYKICG